MKERNNEEEREQYNLERWKKVEADMEAEKIQAAINKKKLDQELAMQELHRKKKKELNKKEVELCMDKLKEIENRVDRGVHNMEERRDERVTYLKTQALLCNP